MRLDPKIHSRRPFRVHSLAADFRLLDVWRIPVGAPAEDEQAFCRFLDLFIGNGMNTDGAIANALFAVRRAAGRVLAWDAPRARPVPGSDVSSVASRLDPAERADGAPPREGPEDLGLVYERADEALFEISNETVHALIHVGWVDDGRGGRTAELAVYVRPRGALGRFYMAAIGPFRHAFVYPAWIARLVRLWRERERRRGAGASAPAPAGQLEAA